MKTIEDYDQEIRQNPNDAGAYNDRGLMHRKNGNYDKAIADLTKAIQINPNNVEPYYNRGLVYMNIDEPEKAFDDYNNVIRLAPDNAETYAKRGVLNSHFGNIQGAISDYEEFLRLDPDNNNAKLVREELIKLKSGEIPPKVSSTTNGFKKFLIIIIIGGVIGAFFGLAAGLIGLFISLFIGIGFGQFLAVLKEEISISWQTSKKQFNDNAAKDGVIKGFFWTLFIAVLFLFFQSIWYLIKSPFVTIYRLVTGYFYFGS